MDMPVVNNLKYLCSDYHVYVIKFHKNVFSLNLIETSFFLTPFMYLLCSIFRFIHDWLQITKFSVECFISTSVSWNHMISSKIKKQKQYTFDL